MSTKIRTPKLFNDNLRATLEAYGKASAEIDDKYDALLDELVESAEAALQEQNTPPVAVGTRVWVGEYKREGTVTKAKLSVCVVSDDYYSPRSGPERYCMPDEEYDSKWGNYPRVAWLYTIQTDPSPKLGRVGRSVTQWSVQLEKGGPAVGGYWDDSLDDDDDDDE